MSSFSRISTIDGKGWIHGPNGAMILSPNMPVLREWAVIDWDMRYLPLTELVVDSVNVWIDGVLEGWKVGKVHLGL